MSVLYIHSVAILPPDRRCEEENEEIVREVERWSKEHPIKTRQSEFMKLYPNVHLSNGIIDIDPCTLDENYKANTYQCSDCSKCRKNFWNEEVK